MARSLKIIHIEDVQSDAELVDRTLKRSGIAFEKVVVDSRDEYLDALNNFEPDIILSDHSLPSFNSLEALKILKQKELDIPFILITATVSEEFAVSVMKEGASDYVLKDRLQRLPNAIVNAVERFQSDADRQDYLNKIVASESLFKKAEQIARFGTWRLNIRQKTLDWSAGNCSLLGYQPGEVEPSIDNLLKNIVPDDLETVRAVFDNAEDIAVGEVDFRVVASDGVIRYIHSQFERELNEVGEPEYIVGFNQDVTSQKLAEEERERHLDELTAAAERQSSVLNAMPAGLVLLNAAGKIIAINESWKRFTIDNNLGMPKYGIDYSYYVIAEKATGVDEDSRKKIADGIREVIAGTIKEFSQEYSFFSSGKKKWFQIIVAPLVDKTKKGAVVLHADITRRKQAEEQMLQSEANLKTIFENTDVAYVLCNTWNKILSFNSKAAELCLTQFGKKIKVGGSAFSYFPKNKIPNVKNAVEKVSNNEMISYETSYPQEDGSVKWYEVRWAGVANSKKENIGFILAFKDVTQRKIADLERDRMSADLAQRYKDLEQFTYIVSHNLRAPVANIIGLSNILNNFDLDISKSSEALGALSRSVNVLDQIIMDLNHILQVRSNVNEQTEEVSFAVLIDEITMSLGQIIKKEKATIRTDFDAAERVITIKSYMHSIFYNLIINAIKYKMPGVEPVISIFTHKIGQKLTILIKDNGRGIEKKNFENLFGLYKRFDTSVEGKGMGLFMVKMQVESLGGKIEIQSEQGKGTTFKLEFPKVKFLK